VEGSTSNAQVAEPFPWTKAAEYRGGGYMSNAEAVQHANRGTVFEVTDVGRSEAGFKGSVRRVVTLSRSGELDTLKSFTVEDADGDPVFAGRAQMLADFAEHLAGGGQPIAVRFVEAGSAVTFEPALEAVRDHDDEAPFPTEEPPEEQAG
jgi:hypothetical protein